MNRLAIVLLLAASAVSCGKNKLKLPQMKMPDLTILEGPTAQERVQKQIAIVMKTEEDSAFFREIAELLEVTRKVDWDTSRLLAQLIDHAPQVQGEQATQRYLRLIDALALPRSAVVAAVAERVENQPQISDVYDSILRGASSPDPRGEADFSQFKSHLEANRANPPQPLLLWMYHRDPGAAMKTLSQIYGDAASASSDLLWSEQVLRQTIWGQQHGFIKSDELPTAAREQLEKLSQSGQWWTRAYIASLLSRHPHLRHPDVLRRLESDPHPLVKTMATRLDSAA